MTLADNSSAINKLKKIQILIVEDEYILAMNLRESLELLGYTVLEIANSAESAIEQATKLHPNLILMDIRLQGKMDGIQAAEKIWNQLKIPVIYVTGHSDQNTVERATLTTPFGYILKPIKDQELYVAIQTALNRYEHEQFLSTVLLSMADGVIVVDTHLCIKYLNQVAEALTGWQLGEVKEQIITEVIQFMDESTQLIAEHPVILALQQETAVHVSSNHLLITKDETTLPVTDSATPLKNNQGATTGIVLVFRDDTQRRLVEERNFAMNRAQQIELQLVEHQRLNQLKDDFLATTSHEMRTPLSNIKLAIQMLEAVLDQYGILNVEGFSEAQLVTRYLTILREQCDQELKLVNDLLDLQFLEADAYPINFTTIPLQNWLSHVAESFQERIRSQHQTLQINVPTNFPPLVSDMSSLTRIVSELLNNACKYTPPNEQIQIIVQFSDPPHTTNQNSPSGKLHDFPMSFVQIILRNSGTTIPSDQLTRIFEPFYRIPSCDPWKHSGTGLGLALVKKLVECLHGTIEVKSDQDWTVFIIQLPLNLSILLNAELT